MNTIFHPFSVAPMIDWTDRHCRFFHRLFSEHMLLYTEMITSQALIHGQRERLLHYSPQEHPIAIQLGGSDPKQLAECAKMAEDHAYDEINFNVGCPSDRVQHGRFGACLMAEPNLVADCVAQMQQTVKIPVTVKTRIGIDHKDSYEELHHFIECVATSACQTFIIHARKAWLKGLSPKENREIPPLQYQVVHQLKKDFPQLIFILNGGLLTLTQALEQMQYVDGVMLGRAAYHNPYILCEVDQLFYQSTKTIKSRQEILSEFLAYIEIELAANTPLHAMTRHILGLWQGLPGARHFRQVLSNHQLSTEQKMSFLRDLTHNEITPDAISTK